jgi:imidazolonepropionase-like amidohydrolase
VQRALHLRGVVLPGDGVQDVFVVAGRITFAEQADAETVLDGGFLIPGLVDAHAHLSIHSPAGDTATADERVRASARAQRGAGVLAIREPGSPDHASHGLGPDEGLPRTITGGRFLAPAGRYIPGMAREVADGQLADAAAEEVRHSGAWAKVIADFPGPDGEITPTYSAKALAEAASRVHAFGGRITAHATIPASVEAVIAAGFDAVEHGTFMRQEQVKDLAASGTVLVPTLIIRDGILGMFQASGAPEAVVDDVRRKLDAQAPIVHEAAERGVTVLAGTDAGMVPHGLIGTEIRLLAAAGLSPTQALAAASWQARSWLGLPLIEEGAPADLVGYRTDPREDPDAVGQPAVILLDGQRVGPA